MVCKIKNYFFSLQQSSIQKYFGKKVLITYQKIAKISRRCTQNILYYD